MPVLPWLWLNEAAQLIATRIPQAQADNGANAPDTLAIAREQLIEAAYRGAIVAEGKWEWNQIEEHPPVLKDTNWTPVNASVWFTHDHFTDANPHGRITVNFEHNAIDIDDGKEMFDCGFVNLRVRAADVDRLWPPTACVQTDPSDQLYETAWQQLMREAIAVFKITREQQPVAKQLQAWFSSQTADGLPVSANMAKAMTTFVRLPIKMRGGNPPSSRRAWTVAPRH
jgi:hypothetical protein